MASPNASWRPRFDPARPPRRRWRRRVEADRGPAPDPAERFRAAPSRRRRWSRLVAAAETPRWRDRPSRRIVVIPVIGVAAMVAVLVAVLLPAPPPAPKPVPAALVSGTLPLDPTALARSSVLAPGSSLDLPRASAPPVAAPPSLADAPPLRSHEVFGFAPYWTLPQSGGFDVNGLTTLAYFSVDANPDGSLDQSGAGWNGYESQALADLVTRAHGAGDRVVLTVTCFDQGALDAITSDPSAPGRLSAALLAAVEAKKLDGVNIDFEGEGSADQQGLTKLVAAVSSAFHAADTHYQVTMDTYASSAGDPAGFYDIPALAPSVDGFFVMAYQLNLAATPSSTSPLTSTMFSVQTTAQQYSAVVDPAKVIMGVPFYGYDWPTTDGTLTAQATGGAVPVTYGQVVASGHPIYWDQVTDTAWTSYQVGGQWHETFFEDPTSLYMEAQLAQHYNLDGMGIWALGFEGRNASALAALDGFAPPLKGVVPGPTRTAPSTGPGAPTPAPFTRAPTATTAPASAHHGRGGPGSTTTTTTAPGFSYTGTFGGRSVTLVPSRLKGLAAGAPAVGTLADFQTSDPADSCLVAEAALTVRQVSTPTGAMDVVTARPPHDCTKATFTFTPPAPPSGGPGTTTTTSAGPGAG